MRTLTFPSVKQHKYGIPKDTIDNIHSVGTKNGIWLALLNAYDEHSPVILRPDDLYNTICCIWAKYIILNAEAFRSKIVTHEGQKELKYIAADHTFTQENLSLHFDAFTALIQKDGNTSIDWMKTSFSTTTEIDKLLRAAATLASQKKYYKYTSRTMCGFPFIILAGSIEDWQELETTIKSMPTYDSQMAEWQTKLLLVISKFIEADENDIDFWQAPFTEDGGGSGCPTYYKGWATVFTPFTEDGTWNANRSSRGRLGGTTEPTKWYAPVNGEVLDLDVDFDIQLENDFGQHYANLHIFAGPTRCKILNGRCSVLNVIKHEMRYIK